MDRRPDAARIGRMEGGRAIPETVITEMLLAEMQALLGRMDRIEQTVEELQAYRRAKDAEAAALNAGLREMLAEMDAEAEARRRAP